MCWLLCKVNEVAALLHGMWCVQGCLRL
eukprot:COSAG01_NODE_37289_length_505_cov_1.810345_1_plen_27_part_10